jgi:hypothetical protein
MTPKGGIARWTQNRMRSPQLDENSLLWIDLIGRDIGELESIGAMLELDANSLRELSSGDDYRNLDNYGTYYQFAVNHPGSIVPP